CLSVRIHARHVACRNRRYRGAFDNRDRYTLTGDGGDRQKKEQKNTHGAASLFVTVASVPYGLVTISDSRHFFSASPAILECEGRRNRRRARRALAMAAPLLGVVSSTFGAASLHAPGSPAAPRAPHGKLTKQRTNVVGILPNEAA